MYCDSATCFYFGDCNSNDDFGSLDFSFASEDHVFTIDSKYYLFNGAELGYPGACVLGITKTTGTSFVFGTAFLERFYTIYDLDNL